jgi:hypothetical protein
VRSLGAGGRGDLSFGLSDAYSNNNLSMGVVAPCRNLQVSQNRHISPRQ